jgi:hypothetical protein
MAELRVRIALAAVVVHDDHERHHGVRRRIADTACFTKPRDADAAYGIEHSSAKLAAQKFDRSRGSRQFKPRQRERPGNSVRRWIVARGARPISSLTRLMRHCSIKLFHRLRPWSGIFPLDGIGRSDDAMEN